MAPLKPLLKSRTWPLRFSICTTGFKGQLPRLSSSRMLALSRQTKSPPRSCLAADFDALLLFYAQVHGWALHFR
jgi:hypothetical protein